MLKLAKQFAASVLPGVVKPMHSLWNEILGFLFLAFAVMLLRPIWRGYQELDLGFAHVMKFALSVFFFLIMAGFGIHAFWKARKISRS